MSGTMRLSTHINIRLAFKKLVKEQHSSLLKVSVSDEEKSFKQSTTGVNVIKLFSFIADDEAK